jgi:hypothetical protein
MSDIKKDPEKSAPTGSPLHTTPSTSQPEVEHSDDVRRSGSDHTAKDAEARRRLEASRRLANPLAGLGHERLAAMGEEYARKAGLTGDEDLRAFRLGAIVAGDENRYDTVAGLTEAERVALDREVTHKWSNPRMLYYVIVGWCFSLLGGFYGFAANQMASLLSLRGGPGYG